MTWYGGRSQSDTAAANSIVAIVSAATINPTRGLKANAAGTASIVTSNGEIIAGFQLEQGYNPISVTKVTLDGTLTAGNVFALY